MPLGKQRYARYLHIKDRVKSHITSYSSLRTGSPLCKNQSRAQSRNDETNSCRGRCQLSDACTNDELCRADQLVSRTSVERVTSKRAGRGSPGNGNPVLRRFITVQLNVNHIEFTPSASTVHRRPNDADEPLLPFLQIDFRMSHIMTAVLRRTIASL